MLIRSEVMVKVLWYTSVLGCPDYVCALYVHTDRHVHVPAYLLCLLRMDMYIYIYMLNKSLAVMVKVYTVHVYI